MIQDRWQVAYGNYMVCLCVYIYTHMTYYNLLYICMYMYVVHDMHVHRRFKPLRIGLAAAQPAMLSALVEFETSCWNRIGLMDAHGPLP